MGPPPPRNRFSRHPLLTTIVLFLIVAALSEGFCYVLIAARENRPRRQGYPYNRMLSGYTVFRNTPYYDMGSSTIKEQSADPNVALDEFGFVCDRRLEVNKPAGTVRIFLLGGSAAFGAGQNSQYHGVHYYPDGVHTYRLSIAGHLKAFLEEHSPGRRFEVVNAAGYSRQMHQSMLLYLETISRLHPDFVVSFEGFNDISTLEGREPYAETAKALPDILALHRRSESWLNKSNTFYVLSTAYDKYLVRLSRGREPPNSARPETWEPTREEYLARRSRYLDGAKRFEQILRQYLAVLQTDGTRCVFVLQPMLLRSGHNKPLSAVEQAFRRHTLTIAGAQKDSLLVTAYFFDDYFSRRLDEQITAQGATFLDMNQEIEKLEASFEFYTDYCHLRPEGNRYVAERIGERILAQLAAGSAAHP